MLLFLFCVVLLFFDICEQNVLPNRHGAGQREKERQIRQLCRWLFIFLFVFSLIPRHCRCCCCCCYRFPHAHFVFLFTTQPAFLSCDVCRVYLLQCACLGVCVCECANNTRPVACKIQIKSQFQLVITNCQKEQHTIVVFFLILYVFDYLFRINTNYVTFNYSLTLFTHSLTPSLSPLSEKWI